MFKITFPTSTRSKNLTMAAEIAINLGGNVVGGVIEVELSELELFKAYDRLLPLVAIIGNWKGFKGYYNDVPVNPYRFLLKCHFVFECAKESYTENAGEFCVKCRQKHLASHVCPFHPSNNPSKAGVLVTKFICGDRTICLN